MMRIISSMGALAAITLASSQNVNAATIDQTFTQSYQCNSVKFRAQTGVTQQQLITSCNEISETNTAFHNFFNSSPNSPLPNDNNNTLDVYVYLSSAEYKANGNTHFGINTDNGGMYLEGTPSDANNQAKFIAHICEDSWVPFSCEYTGQVYNLQHEYVHYLDGRFNVSGDFGIFSYNAGLTEGLADYLAQGTNYSRTLTGLVVKTSLLFIIF
ncbi:collagenase [Colwellia maritima]|uniref:collagenase n=1 Tax=Colwellia maritima TaxID=2912588 RepID=UPI00237C0610|nr:collagenase [Colwellia maritima]